MKPDRSRAFAPPDYGTERGKAGVFAFQAMAKGQANEGQQKIALDWLINDLCRTYDLSFRPDDTGGDRDTTFAEGRRFIGLQLARILNTSFDNLTGRKV
jgi:hypothetical protein